MHAPASAVAARIGRWATVAPVDSGTCRVQMTVDSLDWPAHALGTAGARFSVLEPPELVELMRDWGTRFTEAANDRSAGP